MHTAIRQANTGSSVILGVHFTRMIGGGVECRPNAVFALGRESYKKADFDWRDTAEALAWPGFRKVALKYWRTGVGEYHRSSSKQAFVKALQRLIPEVESEHLEHQAELGFGHSHVVARGICCTTSISGLPTT